MIGRAIYVARSFCMGYVLGKAIVPIDGGTKMTRTQMIKALKSAISDIEAVIDDLSNAEDDNLTDVNEVYARRASRITNEVVANLRFANQA